MENGDGKALAFQHANFFQFMMFFILSVGVIMIFLDGSKFLQNVLTSDLMSIETGVMSKRFCERIHLAWAGQIK